MLNKILQWSSLFFILLITGCVQTPTEALDPSLANFDKTPYALEGDATVFGQAFLRQRGGNVVLCAGSEVALVPNKEYFRKSADLARRGIQPGQVISKDELNKITRKTTCDAQGNFRFEKVPTGDWLVYTIVTWVVGDYNRQGGSLLKPVQVEAGGEHQVLLTDANRI